MTAAALLVALLLAAPEVAAEPDAVRPPPPATFEVAITSPPAAPAFDTVEFAAEVYGKVGIAQVELWLDGRRVATFSRRPFTAFINVGGLNRAHRFEAVAVSTTGATVRTVLETPRAQIDDQYEVELRQLFVTVTRDGTRVADLGRDDLEVYDGGQRQKIVTFERGDVPLTAVLMLDASQSMRGGRLSSALRGAYTFARGMQPLDEAMVMLFSDRLLRATPFTDSSQVLTAALDDVEAAGSTALNDHLYLALALLDGRQGRRVVVLFSDGADVVSALRMRAVLWKAQRTQTPIYWLRLAERRNDYTSFSSSWRNFDGNQEEIRLLEQAVNESGGRVEDLPTVEAIEPAFAGLLEELRGQYVLGYYPSERRHDGSWRKVEVKVRGLGETVRTRTGYADD